MADVERLRRTAMPFGSAEDVCVTDPARPMCHCATVAALPVAAAEEERLVAAWYAGSAECRPDVALFAATWTLRQGWSAPRLLVDTPGRAEGNAVLGVSPGGVLWLVFATLTGCGWRSARLRRTWSVDGGETWAAAEDLPGAPVGWLVRNKPVAHGSRWLLPVYDEIAWEGFVLASDDDGRTWSAGGRMRAPQGCIQPTLLPAPDGALAALLRCGGEGGPLWQSRSGDGGATWTPGVPAGLHNPNSGCDGVPRADGAWLLACNDRPLPVGRGELALRVSRDGGATWPTRGVVASGAGEYSYPALIPAADGGLHLLYTHERTRIRHLRIRPGWPA